MKRLNKNRKTLATTLILLAVAILIGYFTFAYISKSTWPFIQTSQTTESLDIYTPPTDQEITNSQDAKKNNTTQEQQDSDDTKQLEMKKVSVAIAYAGFDETEKAIDIRAFTPDVIEGNGTCEATLTKQDKTITRASHAFIDSSSSQCEPILIPVNEFPARGEWGLVVTYTSNSYSGTSDSMKVSVGQ